MYRYRIFKNHFVKNLFILAFTVLLGWQLAESPAFHDFLTASRQSELVGSFIGGLFFTSLFTSGPATVALGTIARENSLALVSLIGGIGAVIGDLILFRFFQDYLTEELFGLFGRVKNRRILWIFHLRVVRWSLILVGAAIIALPLPDEIGLALMGLTRLRVRYLIPLSFVLNSSGIALVGLVARAL